MTILKMPLSEACDECGCMVVISESIETEIVNAMKIRKHVNGQQWERRKFLCGKVIGWVPNFESQQTHSRCENTEDFQIAKNKVNKISEQIKKLEEKRKILRRNL